MKKYTIEIDDHLSLLYEGIAQVAGLAAEAVLADTLFKMAEMLLREVDKAIPTQRG